MCSAQAVDFCSKKSQSCKLGKGTKLAYELVRQHIPFIQKDCLLHSYIEQAIDLVTSGRVAEAVNEFTL